MLNTECSHCNIPSKSLLWNTNQGRLGGHDDVCARTGGEATQIAMPSGVLGLSTDHFMLARLGSVSRVLARLRLGTFINLNQGARTASRNLPSDLFIVIGDATDDNPAPPPLALPLRDSVGDIAPCPIAVEVFAEIPQLQPGFELGSPVIC